MQKIPARLPQSIGEHMSIFHPHTMKKLIEIDEKNTRFVHYTSAEVGLDILRTKKIWMRQSCCMNDYMEVEHGLVCLSNAYAGDHGKRLQNTLEKHFPGISKEVEGHFNAWQPNLRYETFVTSMSEHAGKDFEDEDEYGRLSMWRAYGHGVGVALVVKQDPFWSTNTSLGLFSSPVAYLNDADFAEELGILATNLELNGAYLDKIGRDWTRHAMLHAFAAAAVCTKHPGFREEREWRVVRSPMSPFPCPLEREMRTIHGIPQSILLIDLKDDPTTNLVGLEIPAFVERIIIGPSDYPVPIYNAYKEQLRACGVTDPESKLKISRLPLRAASA